MKDQGVQEQSDSFRDKIATVDNSGKRLWIFPRKPSGKYYNARTYVSYGLLALLISGPFLRIGGEPFLLLNVLERKFVILGQVFWPQDFHIFVIAMITMVVFVTLFTVAFGRLFCGWVCPQTIFMEMVFRKIEYWIEGDASSQRKLDRAPWTREKIIKKTAKHGLFYLLSFFIANIFLAYIIGSEGVIQIVTEPVSAHLVGFLSMLAFSGVFYFVFSWMREQVCIAVCPYGRLQGVLLDKHSIVVTYDYKRGEDRAKFRKNENRAEVGKGDCIDCNQCVNVCPTGIDIRNGTQLECVSCTACIDACNVMMEATGQETGLIRHDSEAGIAEGSKFKWTARLKAYSVVLVGLLVVMGVLVTGRNDFETTILRTPGMIFQERTDGSYTNLYNYKIINKTNEDLTGLHIEMLSDKGYIEFIGGDSLMLPKQGAIEGAMFVVFDSTEIGKLKTDIEIGVYDGDELLETMEATFFGPSL